MIIEHKMFKPKKMQMFGFKFNKYEYLLLRCVDNGSESQLQVGEELNYLALVSLYTSARDMAQYLECGALPMSLPAVRFRIPLDARFAEKYHVSPLSILGHCFDVVSL